MSNITHSHCSYLAQANGGSGTVLDQQHVFGQCVHMGKVFYTCFFMI